MIAITLLGKWVFEGFADRYKLHAASTLCHMDSQYKKVVFKEVKLPRFDGHGNSNEKRESRWKRKGSTLSIKRSFGARQWKW
jgi:hypothetical protein